MDRTAHALEQMATKDPELAARLFVQMLPAVLGLELPPPEDLMPGPIASPEEARAAGAPV